MKKYTYSICIILSACLWGTMGYFRRTLGDMGLDSYGVVFVRCFVASICFLIYILIKNPKALIVKARDIWCFVGSGIFSLLFFSICYFQSMNYMSLSAAAILLYTAPAFVIILSAVIFKEKITQIKIVSLILAFMGCCLVSGIVGNSTKITAIGIMYGLGAGFGYALYSIFSKFAIVRGYSSATINFWSCTLAAAGAGILCGFKQPMEIMMSSTSNCSFCLIAGFMTCFLPYALYTYGITGIEIGKASIMASVEPVVATIVGILLFNENPDVYSIIGIALILCAIILLNKEPKHPEKTSIA